MTTFGNFNSGINGNVNYEANGGNNQQQPKQNNQKREPNFHDKDRLRLKLENKTEFKSIIQTAYADSVEFATMINSLMRDLFFDYYGAKIEPVGTQLVATINFAYKKVDNVPNGYYMGLEQTFSKDKYDNDSMARIDMYNKYHGSTKKQNYVQLTKEAKELLMDIIPSQFISSNGKVDWSKCTFEKSTNIIGYNSPQVIFTVVVDFVKILKIIFGDRDANGSNYSYLPCVGKPLNPVMTATNQVIISKWQIFVLRTNNSDVKELMQSLGMSMYGMNNDGIITD